MLSDLGLQRPPAQDREGKGHSEPVSLENLSDIDADYMFIGYFWVAQARRTRMFKAMLAPMVHQKF